jgi:hypothetical protein
MDSSWSGSLATTIPVTSTFIPNSEVRGALGGARLGGTRRWGSQWLYQIDTAPDLPVACAANDGGECGASNLGVRVYDTKGHFLGRFDLKRRVGHEGWQPSKKLLKLITELENEGRL